MADAQQKSVCDRNWLRCPTRSLCTIPYPILHLVHDDRTDDQCSLSAGSDQTQYHTPRTVCRRHIKKIVNPGTSNQSFR